MDCRRIQEEILESLAAAQPAEGRRRIDAHVAGCADCAAFMTKQRALDARLGAALPPPDLSPAFRNTLRATLQRDARPSWPDLLPDAVHFASCGVATLLCVALLPLDAPIVLAASAAATTLTYLLLTEIRSAFESVEEPRL